MRGKAALKRNRVHIARLAGATALACVLAGGATMGVAAAQQIDIDRLATSPDAELLLEADTIVYDNDRNTITAEGGVQIDYDGHKLVARSVTYHQATARLVASGGVEIIDRQGTRIHTDEIDVTDDFRDAFVRTLRVETVDKVYFAADSAERQDGEVTTFNYGVYTACEPCREKPDKAPAWRVKSQKIIWNGKTKTVRFQNASFELFGLPIAWLPVFEIPDPTVKQKSGFMIPGYRGSSELGHGVNVPYYLAFSPTADLTIKPAWYSKQGFYGEAEWRQRFNNGGYSITAAGIRQRDPGEFIDSINDQKRTRLMVGSKGEFDINSRWTFGWDVMTQSDKNFAYRYGVDGYDQYNRTNEVYLTGLNDRNYFDLRFQKFTVQEANPDRDDKQPWVLPTLDYSFTPNTPIAGGELNIDVNLRSIYRNELDALGFPSITPARAVRGIDGSSTRLTAEAEWKRNFITQGGVVLTPILHARADSFNVSYRGDSFAAINSAFPGQTDLRSSNFSAMPTAGLEVRWPVLMAAENSSHVIEPMGQIFARPNAPRSRFVSVPNEDAQSLVFDAANLFERDKFSGYDRIEGGVRANLGMRYSGVYTNGWSSNALFGQSYHLAGHNPYTSPDLVHVGAYSGLQTKKSDYVGMIGFGSPIGISAAASARFDQKTFDVRRTDISAAYSSPEVSVSGLYSFIDAQPDYGFEKDRQEVTANASVRVLENWSVFGSGTFDMKSEVMVRKSIGFAYDDDCFSYSLSMSEYEDPINRDKSRNFGFSISLRTIGDFGNTASALN